MAVTIKDAWAFVALAALAGMLSIGKLTSGDFATQVGILAGVYLIGQPAGAVVKGAASAAVAAVASAVAVKAAGQAREQT
jgi:hypothetical protein